MIYAAILSVNLYHYWFTDLIREHNIVRSQYGLVALSIDEQLMREANNHALWMAQNEALQHAHIRYGAENIAQAEVKPARVVQMWLNSPGHRRNMLNSRYDRIGVGVYKSRSGRYYWCIRFK